jgi:hypothetical protein
MHKTSLLHLSIARLLCAASFSLMGCSHNVAEDRSLVSSSNRQYTNNYNNHLVDTAVHLLRDGDIVLRMGMGADSYLLAMLSKKDHAYSHCGIVIMEKGYPFVYHCIGGEDNPDARMRRDSAGFFFSPLHNTALAIVRYNYGADTINRLKEVVYQFYKTRPRFDLKFDLGTDDYLYCSEFAYKVIIQATADTNYLSSSQLKGGKFIGIDDLYINPHAQMVWQTKFKRYLYHQK